MALTVPDRPAPVVPPPAPVGPLRRWWRERPAVTRWTTVSWVAVGGATTVIVVHGGTSGGRVLRVVASLAVTALGALALRRLPERWAAWSGLVVGTVGLAVGSGIAARHLHAATALEGVAALVAAAAGAVALVAGAGWLVRRARSWRKLAALPVAVVVLALLWPSTVAVMVTNTGPTPLGGATPSDVGLAYEDVSMVTADGVRLDGWYVAPSDGAVVVLRHGSGSNRATLLDHAAVLAGAGYGVLAVDARGHGSSGGDGMDLGWYGAADTSAAVDLLLTRPEVDPSRIAVLGLSMGGEEAITAAGADGRIAAVVAEGATRRVAADDLWLPRHPGGWLQRAMDRWRDLLADRLTAAPPPPALHDAIVDAGSTPVLLIAAGTVPDEGSTAEHLAAAGEDVAVWEVPGADHTGALAADPSGWRARVVAFLDRALAS